MVILLLYTVRNNNKINNNMTFFSLLPPEVFVHICSYLPFKEKYTILPFVDNFCRNFIINAPTEKNVRLDLKSITEEHWDRVFKMVFTSCRNVRRLEILPRDYIFEHYRNFYRRLTCADCLTHLILNGTKIPSMGFLKHFRELRYLDISFSLVNARSLNFDMNNIRVLRANQLLNEKTSIVHLLDAVYRYMKGLKELYIDVPHGVEVNRKLADTVQTTTLTAVVDRFCMGDSEDYAYDLEWR